MHTHTHSCGPRQAPEKKFCLLTVSEPRRWDHKGKAVLCGASGLSVNEKVRKLEVLATTYASALYSTPSTVKDGPRLKDPDSVLMVARFPSAYMSIVYVRCMQPTPARMSSAKL